MFSPGSIGDTVYSGISPFPLAISGILNTIVNNSIFTIENWTGNTLGLVSIADRYQPAVTNLTFGNVLRLMASQEMGVSNVSIGDLSTSNQNLMAMAVQFEDKAREDAKLLTKGLLMFKAR